MRSARRLGAAAAALMLVAIPWAAPAVATEPGGPAGPTGHEPTPTPPRAEGAALTSFYFGKSDRITPVPPYNESAGQEVIASGVSVPRALIANVGTWSVNLVDEQLELESLEGMSIWASSDFGATNVRFIVNVGVNGNTVASLSTDTKATLSAAPAEFTLDPGSGNFPPRILGKSTVLTFQLQYSASSSRGVGPSADSTFHYYGNVFRSRLDFVTNPFNLTLVDRRVDPGHVNVTAIVKEAFGVGWDQKEVGVAFTGPSTSQPEFVEWVSTVEDTVNGSTVTWNWEYAAQGSVGSGIYTISLYAKYVGAELNYTTTNSTDMKFPKAADPGGVLPGPGVAGALAALGGVAVAAAAVRGAAAGGRAGTPPRRRP